MARVDYSVTYDDISEIRPKGTCRPIIFLVGDSIFRGFGVGEFDLPKTHRANRLNKIGLILDLILEDNGRRERACYRGECLQRILMIRDDCRPGDTVVFEDAGPHVKNFDVLFHYFSAALGLAKSLKSGLVISMTNYTPPGVERQYDFSSPLTDQDIRSGNDAIRVASKYANAKLVDIEQIFEEFGDRLFKLIGSKICLDDKVHPNVFGNILYAICIYVSVVGASPHRLEALIAEVEMAWPCLKGRCGVGKHLDSERLATFLYDFANKIDYRL